MPNDPELFILRSGDGYLVRINSGAPEMTSDPVLATRMNREDTSKTKWALELLGFEAVIVPVVIGRIRGGTAHRPSTKELGELSHSACLLFEWSAYREYVAKFYSSGATRVVITVNQDLDPEFGNTYGVSTVEVFAGETKLDPDIDKVNLEAGSEPFTSSSEPYEIEEFLDDWIADLPVPYLFGNVAEDDEITVNVALIPEGAKMAQRIWLEDESE